MTDKQIIIDVCPYQGECSVSGCKRNDDGCFVRQLFEERDRAENRIVELNKTIQAKEQECEELNEELYYWVNGEYCDNKCNVVKELDQLKAENEELKKWKETVVELFERTCRCKYLNEENNHCSFYDRECISINQCLYKNQQTLTEIKEIAKEWEGAESAYMVSSLILQKISECEGSDE